MKMGEVPGQSRQRPNQPARPAFAQPGQGARTDLTRRSISDLYGHKFDSYGVPFILATGPELLVMLINREAKTPEEKRTRMALLLRISEPLLGANPNIITEAIRRADEKAVMQLISDSGMVSAQDILSYKTIREASGGDKGMEGRTGGEHTCDILVETHPDGANKAVLTAIMAMGVERGLQDSAKLRPSGFAHWVSDAFPFAVLDQVMRNDNPIPLDRFDVEVTRFLSGVEIPDLSKQVQAKASETGIDPLVGTFTKIQRRQGELIVPTSALLTMVLNRETTDAAGQERKREILFELLSNARALYRNGEMITGMILDGFSGAEKGNVLKLVEDSGPMTPSSAERHVYIRTIVGSGSNRAAFQRLLTADGVDFATQAAKLVLCGMATGDMRQGFSEALEGFGMPPLAERVGPAPLEGVLAKTRAHETLAEAFVTGFLARGDSSKFTSPPLTEASLREFLGIPNQ